MKTAMILAAGFGTRLLPYSKLRPKPLFPVMGRPLIKHTIQQLRQAGFTKIIVNAHHLGEQITALLAAVPDVIIQQEDIELGTGGGLRLAMRQFAAEPALITNGDIYHRIDYGRIYQEHCRSNNAITMVMHDYPRFNKVSVQDKRIISFAAPAPNTAALHGTQLAFTGIQVINPEILRQITANTFVNIIDVYENYLKNGGRINTITVNDFWHDMGTPADYLALHGHLLPKQSPGNDWQPLNDQGFYKSTSSRIGDNVSCLDWGIIGQGANIGNNVNLQRVVVWDGAVIPDNTNAHDQIIT